MGVHPNEDDVIEILGAIKNGITYNNNNNNNNNKTIPIIIIIIIIIATTSMAP